MFTRAAVDRVGGACLRRPACSLRLVRGQLARGLARRRASCLAAALRDRSGAAAIEFALVAPLFMLLLVGILEISIMFFTSSVIEGATKEAARQIRTGQIQGSGDPLAAFQAELCDSLAGIIDCTEVVFTVQTFSSFSSVSMPLEHDEDGEIVNPGFFPGGSTAVTVVRAVYRWDFMTPMMERVLPGGLAGRFLVSTVAFQNEPY